MNPSVSCSVTKVADCDVQSRNGYCQIRFLVSETVFIADHQMFFPTRGRDQQPEICGVGWKTKHKFSLIGFSRDQRTGQRSSRRHKSFEVASLAVDQKNVPRIGSERGVL